MEAFDRTPGVSAPGRESAPDLLVLHALRLKGMADDLAVASRFSLDHDLVRGLLLRYEAAGLIRRVGFVGVEGWALTDLGRGEDSRRLADEVELAGARKAVTEAYEAFLPLNKRFLVACTNWQIRPLRWDPMAINDHIDYRWDERVLDELGSLGRALRPLCGALAGELQRFDGYSDRYGRALSHAERGERSWVDGARIDSCHTVWMELHEDLLATLGKQRGDEA